VNEEGEAALSRQNSSADMIADSDELPDASLTPTTPPSSGNSRIGSPSSLAGSVMIEVRHPRRQVPAHLKELCAQSLTGGMRCLFCDDKASTETLEQRSHRQKSIMFRQLDGLDVELASKHQLRDIKSRKRLMRKAARIFNTKASQGIEFLVDSGLVPDPVTPKSVALFLRTGIVVGIDKKAVGEYLGDAGKSPSAGKSPASWERDWFHKEVLDSYCELFGFEQQSLLDGLRMFLACFRLPGEAQQIDRILQAFSDSCSRVCEESKQDIFSDDLKRASDAAYLLSFSVILLNTDLHNANIREDRKMSRSDFVKNNVDYGRDITEKGKEFPVEFLEGIYDSIRDEEIRTEGEGADGAMTVERWKDVLRWSKDKNGEDEKLDASTYDAEDLTELVLEHAWKPIVSAIGALWGARLRDGDHFMSPQLGEVDQGGGMLGVQGARLGMDLAVEMLNGVRRLGRFDVFSKIFIWVCDYTGLLGAYNYDAVDRTWNLTRSVEAQSAVVVVLTTAIEAAEYLDEDCWKHLWCILFELRDLKLLPHRIASTHSILLESDPDLLSESARRDWTIGLIKGDMDFDEKDMHKKQNKGSSIWGAIFGSDTTDDGDEAYDAQDDALILERSNHGKGNEVVWDGSAPSDTEDDTTDESDVCIEPETVKSLTAGARFEDQFISESLKMSIEVDTPVTGLERVDETRRQYPSSRARVRERICRAANLSLLISETRFFDNPTVLDALKALVKLVVADDTPTLQSPNTNELISRSIKRQPSDLSSDTLSFSGASTFIPMSPASKALAEVLICEIALKNKSRISMLWSGLLRSHYLNRLANVGDDRAQSERTKLRVDPSIEKCVTGMLRITICAVQRGENADDILSCWKHVVPKSMEQHAHSPLRRFERHLGEGTYAAALRSFRLPCRDLIKPSVFSVKVCGESFRRSKD
jgi:hypothetical protein